MTSTSAGNGSIVDFDTAMQNFQSMFPSLSSKQIEAVLRENDGDVESSINSLLKMSNGDAGNSLGRNEPGCSTSTPYTRRNDARQCSFEFQPNCENDEKIALMLQNKEFLRYLKSNPHFMHELNSDYPDHYSPTKRHETVLSRCKRHHNNWTTHQLPTHSHPMDNEKIAIPDGPLVDPCERPLTRLSKKIKSKLPSIDNNSVPKPESIYPNTVLVDYSSADERFMHRLKNMSRNPQAMFMSLAKKFMSSKPSALMPTSYADQSNDFSYDIHNQNASSKSH